MVRLERRRVLVAVHGGAMTGIDTYAEHMAATAGLLGDATLMVGDAAIAGQLRARLVDTAVRVIDMGLPALSPVERRRLRISPASAAARLRSALRTALLRLGEEFDVAQLNHPSLAPTVGSFAATVSVAAWFRPPAAARRFVETWRHTGGGVPRRIVLAAKGLSHHRLDVEGFRAADCVIAPTRTLAIELMSRGFNAVECPPPCRLTAAPAAGARLPAPQGRPRLVVCAGDLSHPRKNVGAAIRGVALMCRWGGSVQLELIGRNASALRRDLARLPSSVDVFLPGALSHTEVMARIAGADLLLFPSLFEEWGYVAAEAVMHGTPVVTFPVYPFAEMIPPPMGWVAEELSDEAYSYTIEGLLAVPPSRTEVRRAAEERFGPAAVARRLEGIWREAGLTGATRRGLRLRVGA